MRSENPPSAQGTYWQTPTTGPVGNYPRESKTHTILLNEQIKVPIAQTGGHLLWNVIQANLQWKWHKKEDQLKDGHNAEVRETGRQELLLTIVFRNECSP